MTRRRYDHLPALAALIDERGLPLIEPTLFLASCAIRGRGLTEDTSRTYGENLRAWLCHLEDAGVGWNEATEEDLQIYRSRLFHLKGKQGRPLASTTVHLRITVAAAFHRWGQRNGYASPLGEFLLRRTVDDRSLSPRIVYRHPQIVSQEEIVRIFGMTKPPYKLAFRWALVTGIRRFEVAWLKRSSLPNVTALPFNEDRLAKIHMGRKGGKDLPVYAPCSLVEETHWYCTTARPVPLPPYEDHVFLSKTGGPLSRASLSREFHRCATAIGSTATLHHLRHTYAVSVLGFLERSKQPQDARNSLKTVQVLLGHRSIKTTELYLRAMEVTSPEVVSALDHLYGGTLH